MKCNLGNVEQWFKDKGDQTHRINYPLNTESIVVDLGAYEGKWSEQIANKYKAKIYAYEPVKSFYSQSLERLSKYPSVQVFHYGLGNKTQELEIGLSKDGSSLYIRDGLKEKILIKEVGEEISQLGIKNIDLIKINIEGAEYPLLQYVLEKGFHKRMKNIQVQFHILDEESSSKREAIRKELSQTHELTYDYPFVWENWRIK